MKAIYSLNEAIQLIELITLKEVQGINRITDRTFHYTLILNHIPDQYFNCSREEETLMNKDYAFKPAY